MNENSCLKDFLKYSGQSVTGMIGLSCYILADTFFISKGLGADGLAALNLAIPVYSFIHGSGLMIGMGGATRFSIQKSQRDDRGADRTFFHGILLTAVFAALFFLTGLLLSDKIAYLLGARDNVYAMTRIYLQVILLFAPAFMSNNLLLCFVRNDGSPQLSMTAMISGSLANILLDWIFIFPCKMGIFGAVLATGIAPVISMAILSVHFISGKNTFKPLRCLPEAGLVKKILSTGVPSLITEVSSGLVIIVFNFIILDLEGSIGVAAYGVIANISLVVIAVYTGIAQGMQPVISTNYGAANHGNVGAVLRYAVISCVIISAAVYGVIFFGAQGITEIFNSEGNELLQQIAEKGLRIYFIGCVFAGFNIILAMYFTSSERPVPAQAISLLRGIILIIPVTFVLSVLWRITGVWSAFPVTEFIVSIIGIILLKKSGICKKFT